ncbi:MAG: chorismate lyase [Gammaproteobacteria bacterium]|nr:MAG: chorismate lyase [Gammaproteobacteria bacterium]
MTAAAPAPACLSRTLLRSLDWYPADHRHMRGVPAEWADWLFDAGSLTQRLKDTFGEDTFRVRVLSTRAQFPTADEAALLGITPRHACWTREVVLVGAQSPRVLARTLIPQRFFRGPARQLRLLGTRPLGAALFRCPDLVRHPMQFTPVPSLAGMGGGWARRSVFDYYRCPVLVSEFFMAACLAPPLS